MADVLERNLADLSVEVCEWRVMMRSHPLPRPDGDDKDAARDGGNRGAARERGIAEE